MFYWQFQDGPWQVPVDGTWRAEREWPDAGRLHGGGQGLQLPPGPDQEGPTDRPGGGGSSSTYSSLYVFCPSDMFAEVWLLLE